MIDKEFSSFCASLNIAYFTSCISIFFGHTLMKIEFKPEELITKSGKTYPVVGGRLRVAHEDYEKLSINTTLIEYSPTHTATMRAEITSEKGAFSAYGAR